MIWLIRRGCVACIAWQRRVRSFLVAWMKDDANRSPKDIFVRLLLERQKMWSFNGNGKRCLTGSWCSDP